MKHIQTFIIPDGVFGYLNILPDVTVQVLDHWNWVWKDALRMHSRGNIIEVPQCELACSDLAAKEWIYGLIDDQYYHALLVRHNNYFGLARAAKEFIALEQRFVK